ncbi:mitochondrial carrier [Pisolithus albus]|nr:mitochondrial carrier [Pisolithus albus]
MDVGFHSASTANELIAGSVGGAAQVLVGQPLDTIKTRAQIASRPMDILVRTIRTEGFFALYKGMASPLIGIAGVNSLLFASYAISKRIVSPFPQLTLPQIALAGAMAGSCECLEMFKVRMQGQYGAATDKRLRDVAREMWQDWGFKRGIMRGYWVTVAREIPAYAGYFSKRRFQSQYGEHVPIWALLTSGATGGIAYWLCCYPLDVVKSRIQLRPTPPTSRPWTYINAELRSIVADSGVSGLFRGLSPSLWTQLDSCMYSIPAAASTFAAFELTRDFLRELTGV